jgi:hypothetical protein
MKKIHLLLIPAVAVLGSSLCSAAVYNVKFLSSGTQVPVPVSSLQGVIGSTGESWNQGVGGVSGLVASTGGPASGINVSGLNGGDIFNPAADSIFAGNSDLFGRGDNQTISITGLALGGTYDIYIYALTHNPAGWGSPASAERAAGAFITTNASGNGTNQSLDNGITGTNATTFTAGGNYVLFQSIVADGSGNVSIVADALDGANPTRLHINGLQIQQVPEASAAMLGALGALALLRRRRA